MKMVSTGYNHAETLQKLERLTHLETVVAEQRIRIEKYKAMYETLKEEQIQTDNLKSKREEELELLKQEVNAMSERHRDVMQKSALEYDAKAKECEQLRLQVLTPQKLEVLKMRLQNEAEGRYKSKIESSDVELKNVKTEFNKLRYDHTFLKSEFEHEKANSKTVLKTHEMQYKLQIDSLLKERSAIQEELQEQKVSLDAQKMRNLNKENTHLLQKIKSLHEELDEIQHEKETTGSQSDQISKIKTKQLHELSRKCKSLETERETSKLQIERLQLELEKNMKSQDQVLRDIDSCQDKCKALETKLEETIHNCKIEINNVQISSTNKHGDIVRERDSLKSEIRTYQQKLSVLNESIENLKTALSHQEEEITERVMIAQREERNKLADVEEAKAQLEEIIEEKERQSSDLKEKQEKKIELLENDRQLLSETKENMEKEIQQHKLQLQANKTKLSQYEQDKIELDTLRKSTKQSKSNLENLQMEYQKCLDERNSLENKVELLQNELRTSQKDLQLYKDTIRKELNDSKMTSQSKMSALVQEKATLSKELDNLKEKHQKFIKTAKKRYKQQKQDVVDLQDKLDLLKMREDQTQKEKQAAVQTLNLEHGRTKRRLEKLKQCHNQFHQVLNATSVGVPDINPVVNLSNVSGIILQPREDAPQPDSNYLDDDFHSTPIPDE